MFETMSWTNSTIWVLQERCERKPCWSVYKMLWLLLFTFRLRWYGFLPEIKIDWLVAWDIMLLQMICSMTLEMMQVKLIGSVIGAWVFLSFLELLHWPCASPVYWYKFLSWSPTIPENLVNSVSIAFSLNQKTRAERMADICVVDFL